MCDVSMGTLRTKQVAMGRRGIAATLGFFEVLIWVAAVSSVVSNLTNPLYALSYAFGHAAGVYLGLTIDRRLALGNQVIRIFTRQGTDVATQLRNDGHRVTEFTGRGRDGEVQLLYCEAPKRNIGALATKAREVDESCFYIIEDINLASGRHKAVATDTGITSVFKKK
jgi:uncharacterized protein YebE (UPF0316 family)